LTGEQAILPFNNNHTMTHRSSEGSSFRNVLLPVIHCPSFHSTQFSQRICTEMTHYFSIKTEVFSLQVR